MHPMPTKSSAARDQSGSQPPMDTAIEVRVSEEDLARLTNALTTTPAAGVPFTAEFYSSGVYATLRASQVQTLILGPDEYVAVACQITDIVTGSAFSAGFAMSESCTLLVPAAPHSNGGIGYLIADQY